MRHDYSTRLRESRLGGDAFNSALLALSARACLAPAERSTPFTTNNQRESLAVRLLNPRQLVSQLMRETHSFLPALRGEKIRVGLGMLLTR